MPILATEAYFRPEERRFIARVERGEVEMGSWGEPYAVGGRMPPFDGLSMEWGPDCGYVIID